jgi:hypothetical protein
VIAVVTGRLLEVDTFLCGKFSQTGSPDSQCGRHPPCLRF